MAKEILKLLDNVEKDLKDLALPADAFTLSCLIYTNKEGGMSTGQLRFKLSDVLAAATALNKKLNKLAKIEKRLAALEK